MKLTIFNKLLLSFITVILICTITLGALMSYLMRSHIIEKQRSDLFSKGRTAISLLEPYLSAGHMPSEKTLTTLGDLVGATIWLTSPDGTVMAGKPPQRWLRVFPEKAEDISALFSGTSQSWVHISRKHADPSIVVALPVPGLDTPTALFLYTPITGINKSADALENLLLYALLIGMMIAAIVSYFISRSLTRSVSDISRAATNFANGDYSARTTATGDDEIGNLGHTLNTMAESLANVEQNRRDFLANVTHELKTPITSIQAMAEAILDGLAVKPGQHDRYLSTIVNEARRIDRLIGDLLNLSQLEAGKLSIVAQEINFGEFILTETGKYNSIAGAKNLSFVFDISSTLPPVWADPDRLAQVLGNIVSNAIRYAPEGTAITIKASRDSSFALIEVSDNGPGIPSDDLPFIWDRFYRVNKSRSRNDGGTGLGLSITKKLVEAMGGMITVKSLSMQGTTFSFTLPLQKS